MSASNPNNIGTKYEGKLDQWDWILLPILGLLTIVFVAVSAEAIARGLFPVSESNLGSCFAMDDPSGNSPAKPNSVCSERTAESRFPVEYRFNDRGDREDYALETKQPSTYRIVMIGSSFAMGLFIPREMTFAAILPTDLSRQTGRTVELYNEAKGGKFRGGAFPIKDSALRFHETLSAEPDLILWIITPMDIENSELNGPQPKPQVLVADMPRQGEKSSRLIDVWGKLRNTIAQGSFGRKLRERWEQSRSALVLKHFLITS
jgi:hypothetical protein